MITIVYRKKIKQPPTLQNYISRTSWGRPQNTSYGFPHIILYVTPRDVPYGRPYDVEIWRLEDFPM